MARSKEDQVISQLVGFLHDRAPIGRHNKLKLSLGKFDTGDPALVARGFDLRGIITRWIRAFHAALYQEHLP